jgi:hypothetical protein
MEVEFFHSKVQRKIDKKEVIGSWYNPTFEAIFVLEKPETELNVYFLEYYYDDGNGTSTETLYYEDEKYKSFSENHWYYIDPANNLMSMDEQGEIDSISPVEIEYTWNVIPWAVQK